MTTLNVSKETLHKRMAAQRETIERLRAEIRTLHQRIANRDKLIIALRKLNYHPDQSDHSIDQVEKFLKIVKREQNAA